ncbi:hypothetical protein [Leptospira sp. GIMC2001]|uniref:hypothetical protein n=1 Tax=Leptospira sp. GIMC2001 TaxID=1513297 RepID=UPI00234BFA94|nr:hypothetical protein [Leptospira sp. GIMC2001]WCL49722.1 hypothetical protein O4O04_02565 [Leptospira sp. GIMC2001]
MANFDRIDIMNYLKYGNDFDEQWDEIRQFIKTNAAAQKDVEEIKRTLPQQSSAMRKRPSNFEMPVSQETKPPIPATPGKPTPPGKQQSWWSKILGDD